MIKVFMKTKLCLLNNDYLLKPVEEFWDKRNSRVIVVVASLRLKRIGQKRMLLRSIGIHSARTSPKRTGQSFVAIATTRY